MWFYCGKTIVFKGSGCNKQWKSNGKIAANLRLEKKHPKIQQKSFLGGSWDAFGRILRLSWASFGCFWPPLDRFWAIQDQASFRHWRKMGSKRASGGIWGPSGEGFEADLGGFGGDLFPHLWMPLRRFDYSPASFRHHFAIVVC